MISSGTTTTTSRRRPRGRRSMSVVLRALVLLVVAACGGATSTAGPDDAGVGTGGDAASLTGLHGGAGCGALDEPCCTIAALPRPIVEPHDPREFLSAQGGTCSQGLTCVMSTCETPSAADANVGADGSGHVDVDANAKPAGEAGTGAAPGGHPVGPILAVGGDHSCVLRGEELECWGSNSAGQLGISVNTASQSCDVPCSRAPVAVTGLSASVESIAAGESETCALLAGGSVACWGTNESGQLGDGSSSGPDLCDNTPCSTTPVVVSGLSGAIAIATNGNAACAVLSSGAVECWGSNIYGELGNGSVASGNPGGASSVPLVVSGLTGATAVAVGGYHACALLLDGTIQCWGYNVYGQLGDGSTTDSTAPVPVSNVTGAVAIAAGTYNTCALLADGTVVCWGDNASGNLGLGTSIGPQTCSNDTPCATTPVKVPDLSGVTAIAAGDDSTCALLSDGTVRCWGSNAYGELGDGTQTPSATPVEVSGVSGASAIAMGWLSVCVLVSSGDVVCWGDDSWGQLGSAFMGSQTCGPCSPMPVDISGL
jgi:alpha-tubulin suppressor-like RCC1 family protein